ncbi:DNA/RNA non-specific endonuclease [Granulosicoccaceae sp. 1_MG-2023]|nr:DNA/RNA non-specific endonuclease [Granulosicoccaceae sp. 1_MG-2023]
MKFWRADYVACPVLRGSAKELIVTAEPFEEYGKQAVTVICQYITDSDPQRFTPSNNIGLLNALIKLQRLMVKDGHTWRKARLTFESQGGVTDSDGRTTNVTSTITEDDLDTGVRNCYQQGKVGSCGLDDDEGGHLIATKLGGPSERINLVPQNMNLNRSIWKRMENRWAKRPRKGIKLRSILR